MSSNQNTEKTGARAQIDYPAIAERYRASDHGYLSSDIQPEAIDWSKAKALDTQASICDMGIATIDEIGSENVYLIKEGLPYYFKPGSTGKYAVGEHDFSKDDAYSSELFFDVFNDPQSQRSLNQSILQSLIDDFKWINQGSEGHDLFWVTKSIGGGHKNMVNNEGVRRLSAKFEGGHLVAKHGDSVLVSVLFDTKKSPKDNAGALDNAVNSIDPNFVNKADMRGLSFAIEKGGKILTSGSIPSLIEQSDLTSISHYTNMADHYAGNLYVGGMNADKFKGDLNYVISGLTWSDIQAKQQKINPLHSNESTMPADSVLVYSANPDQLPNERTKDLVKAQAVRQQLLPFGFTPSDNGLLMTLTKGDFHLSVETIYRENESPSYRLRGLNRVNGDALTDDIEDLYKSPLLLAKLIDEWFTTNVSAKNLMIEADKLFGSEDDGPSQGH